MFRATLPSNSRTRITQKILSPAPEEPERLGPLGGIDESKGGAGGTGGGGGGVPPKVGGKLFSITTLSANSIAPQGRQQAGVSRARKGVGAHEQISRAKAYWTFHQ